MPRTRSPLSRREVLKFGHLKRVYNDVEFVLYPDAPHAFFSDDRPQVYKKEAADDAWKRCLAFFDKHLRA
jgi:carboxymethylenebutenolidase